MRKPFLDNLRYGIVLSVAVYHVFYQFNSVGVITNVLIPGIPALDAPLYVLYPWFMAALFMISGICARYSLEKQTGKQYLKGKVRRQLIPSIAIIFLIGWSTGWVTDQYANIFGDNGGQIPGLIKYFVWCMSGIGVLGAGKRWLDKETAFTRCMASRSFGIYVLHNPLLVLLAWAMDKLLHFPVWSMYLLLPVLLALLLPPLIALIKRIPVLRTLVLGEK